MAEVICPHCQSDVSTSNEQTASFVCPECQREFLLEFEEDEFDSFERELAQFNHAPVHSTELVQKKNSERPFVRTQHDVCFFDEKSDVIGDATLITLYLTPAVFILLFLIGTAEGGFSEGISWGATGGVFILFFLSLVRLLFTGDLSGYEYWFINNKTKQLTFTVINELGTPMVTQQKSFTGQLSVVVQKNGWIIFHDTNWRIPKDIHGRLKSKRRFTDKIGFKPNQPESFKFDMDYWGMVLATSDPLATRNFATSCRGRIRENELILLRTENSDGNVLVILLTDALLGFLPMVYRFIIRKVLTVRQVNKPLFWSSRERTYLDKQRKTLIIMKQFTRGWIPSRLIKITHTSIKMRHVSHNDGDSYTVYDLYLNRYDNLTFSSDVAAKSMMGDIERVLPSMS